MTDKKIRVRFAPSPTGPLHMGGVRTALFNYLFAKKNNGTFILRIEDTDQTRYVQGAEQYIVESLDWCGITPDEGVNQGGNFGSYRQSERKDIYRKYAEQLIEKGFAYYAFDTAVELEEMRKKLKEQKSSVQQYGPKTRMSMKNSLTLPASEVDEHFSSGQSYVIRFKMPENEFIEINDLIRGKIKVNTSELDDKILFKSDGMPTYHLANVVDDYLMQISHVIRGEEWLPSLPLHFLLYRSFEWFNEMPEFAHAPLLLKPNGKGKLSKRDGDKLGFPVFPLNWKDPVTGETAPGYRETGYFPEAFVNILALLGWNPGTEQEIFSLDELIQAFDIKRVGKAGARFDPEKAKWFNHHYLQKKTVKELALLYHDLLKEKGIDAELDYIENITALIKERADFVSDFWSNSYFFFQRPDEYNPKAIKKRWKKDTPQLISELKEMLASIMQWDANTLELAVKEWIEQKEIGFGKVMNPLRLAIVGDLKGPHMFDIIALIGKKETLSRIENALQQIKKDA